MSHVVTCTECRPVQDNTIFFYFLMVSRMYSVWDIVDNEVAELRTVADTRQLQLLEEFEKRKRVSDRVGAALL